MGNHSFPLHNEMGCDKETVRRLPWPAGCLAMWPPEDMLLVGQRGWILF